LSTLLELILIATVGVVLTFILQKLLVAPGFNSGQVLVTTPYPTVNEETQSLLAYPEPEKTGTVQPTPSSSIPHCVGVISGLPSVPKSDPRLYEFYEPSVVLKSETNLDIAGWLPDDEQLLITQQIPNKPKNSILVLDSISGDIKDYGESITQIKHLKDILSAPAGIYQDQDYNIKVYDTYKIQWTSWDLRKGIVWETNKIHVTGQTGFAVQDSKLVIPLDVGLYNIKNTWGSYYKMREKLVDPTNQSFDLVWTVEALIEITMLKSYPSNLTIYTLINKIPDGVNRVCVLYEVYNGIPQGYYKYSPLLINIPKSIIENYYHISLP